MSGGEAQASEDEDSKQVDAILAVDAVIVVKLVLAWDPCWETSKAWLAGLRRARRLVSKLVWYGLGRLWGAGVVFVFCLLLRPFRCIKCVLVSGAWTAEGASFRCWS